MTFSVKMDRPAAVPLANRSFETASLAIRNIPGLTGWFDADTITVGKGLRWKSRVRDPELTPYRNLPPLSVVASHGKPALQVGFGNPNFASTDRGSFCAGEGTALLGASGWTVVMAFRPFAASETGSGSGGYLFATRNEQGANPELTVTPDNTDVRLVIQSTDGRAVLRGGNGQCQIPVDLLTGSKWRVLTAYFDDDTNKLGLRLDGGANIQEVTTATSPMPSHIGALAPMFGIFNAANALPFYGQISGIATTNRMLSTAEMRLIETRFASDYGVTIA